APLPPPADDGQLADSCQPVASRGSLKMGRSTRLFQSPARQIRRGDAPGDRLPRLQSAPPLSRRRDATIATRSTSWATGRVPAVASVPLLPAGSTAAGKPSFPASLRRAGAWATGRTAP